jgi:hypothetical protein
MSPRTAPCGSRTTELAGPFRGRVGVLGAYPADLFREDHA